jgi:hypothetical protein
MSASDFWNSSEKAKSPLGELCASGPGFPIIAWLSVLLRRHVHRMVMVMVVMVMGQRSHFTTDTRASEMPLSIGFYPG